MRTLGLMLAVSLPAMAPAAASAQQAPTNPAPAATPLPTA